MNRKEERERWGQFVCSNDTAIILFLSENVIEFHHWGNCKQNGLKEAVREVIFFFIIISTLKIEYSLLFIPQTKWNGIDPIVHVIDYLSDCFSSNRCCGKCHEILVEKKIRSFVLATTQQLAKGREKRNEWKKM